MRLYCLAIPTIALVTATACSDSTGPSAVARHFDALLSQACAAADSNPTPGLGYNTNSGYLQRCILLGVLITAPASGAEPSPLRVTTATGTAVWQGLVVEYTDTNQVGTPVDSSFEVIAFSDDNVTTAVVGSEFMSSDSGMYLEANDTVTVNARYPSTFSVSTASRGGRCSDTHGLPDPLDNPYDDPPIEYSPSICRLSTFAVSMTGTFPVAPGVDTAFVSVRVPSQTVNGITVFNSPTGVRLMRSVRR
jgi:hypothetical protein